MADIHDLRALVQARATTSPIAVSDLCRRCVDALNVRGATINLRAVSPDGERIAASDAFVAEIDDLQTTLGQGPACDAMKSGVMTFATPLTEHIARWPQFAPVAIERNIVGIAGLPLTVGVLHLGALNLYYTERVLATAVSDAMTAAAIVTDTLLLQQRRALDEGSSALPVNDELHRVVVHQATGMISVQLTCSIPDAMAQLRAFAFANDRPIIAVAREVVDRTLKFT